MYKSPGKVKRSVARPGLRRFKPFSLFLEKRLKCSAWPGSKSTPAYIFPPGLSLAPAHIFPGRDQSPPGHRPHTTKELPPASGRQLSFSFVALARLVPY